MFIYNTLIRIVVYLYLLLLCVQRSIFYLTSTTSRSLANGTVWILCLVRFWKSDDAEEGSAFQMDCNNIRLHISHFLRVIDDLILEKRNKYLI